MVYCFQKNINLIKKQLKNLNKTYSHLFILVVEQMKVIPMTTLEINNQTPFTHEQLMLRFDYFLAFLVGFDHVRYAKIDRTNGRQLLEKMLNMLNDTEQTIIALRFGFQNGSLHDLSECARKMNLSRGQVREQFDTIITKLQNALPTLTNS